MVSASKQFALRLVVLGVACVKRVGQGNVRAMLRSPFLGTGGIRKLLEINEI